MTNKDKKEIAQLFAYAILLETKNNYDGNNKAKTKQDLCTLFLKKDDQIIQAIDSLSDYIPTDRDRNEVIKNLSSISSYLKNYMYCDMIDAQKENMEIYDIAWNEYIKILEEYKKLATSLKIKDSLDLSNFISYLLWNGFFSINKKHRYQLNDNLKVDGFYSLNVFRGKGVCLNYSQLLSDFLKTCGINSSVLCCYLDSVNLNYKPKIKRNFNTSKADEIKSALMAIILNKLLKLSIGNHAITLVDGKNGLYCYDPTNLAGYNIINPHQAAYINGKGTITTLPTASALVDITQDSNALLLSLYGGNNYSTITRKEFKDRFEHVISLLESNKPLMDQAYASASDSIKTINQQIRKINRQKQLKR